MTGHSLAVRVSGLSFEYGSRSGPPLSIFRGLSLEIYSNRITAFMGGNGTGKSTLGRLLARQLSPTQGTVSWASAFGGRADIAYLGQDPLGSVFPWQTVTENLSWPLKKLGWPAGERVARVQELTALFGLGPLGDKYPHFLSGGERQRLAVARCLSWRPKAIIMDEPLAALDVGNRERMWSHLNWACAAGGCTILLITHFPADVLALAHRCMILGPNPGQISADLEIVVPFPRVDSAPGYSEVQRKLLDLTWRAGVL